ncbi:tyrosine-protein phosphatase non-receptor type 1 [Kryptolebias marmoratus]|uniref:Tyrosine-protein phosphatase non-receptor type n=1 Tax=Kryptolebias marmoratus TaxID=37003 RepID=A0A3Q3GL67_KRYMA|nr:tyrosine-protein phosphatase non-receptor type 1 [Kryptolebias marmoratus]XP_017294524.1 tyrosine-protein phosphatase non-receptor type 1 [Kryptolebias marmoratus]
MEAEFWEIDENGSWNSVYQEIRQQSSELPCKVAKLLENKSRNRYRDVSPFDHSRICLQLGTNDYINASLITVEEAQRNYILTQGPLPTTCGHFWEMVWEQRTRGVVMLNRVIEKGSIKCAQYWPHREEKDALFEDTNFKVTLVSEDVKSYYTVRQLELENLSTQETREILHFHYTTWPDFGVPESPASFLNFLFKVRESGCLNSDHGPVVVHCSAGIGRSGTFCLVDTCLLLMSLRKDPSSVRIRDVLLEMRRYRMGLIQTADQLRFSYLAVIEGAKYIKGDTSLQESWKELSNEEDDPPELTPPPPPPRDPYNGKPEEPSFFPDNVELIQKMEVSSLGSSQDKTELRKRTVGFPEPPPPHKADQVDGHLGAQSPISTTPNKPQQDEPEELDLSEAGRPTESSPAPGPWSPLLVSVCLCTALAFSAYVGYRAYFH